MSVNVRGGSGSVSRFVAREAVGSIIVECGLVGGQRQLIGKVC